MPSDFLHTREGINLNSFTYVWFLRHLHNLLMPRLGPTMASAVISDWKKREGDIISKGEIVMIVETEKVSMEVESPVSGKIAKIVAPEGTELQVGELAAIIVEEGEQTNSDSFSSGSAAPTTQNAPGGLALAPEPTKSPTEEAPESDSRFRASPAARRLAREHNVDLSKVSGPSPDVRIGAEDVQAFIEGKSAPKIESPRIAKVIGLTQMRKTISKRLVESSTSSALVTLFSEFDLNEFVQEYKTISSESQVKLTYTDFFVKLVAQLLPSHALLNASLVDDEIRVFEDVNIGLATSVEDGLVVPVVVQANKKSLLEIARISRDLVERARAGKLTESDMAGGTFTISNLGMSKIDGFTPILNPPQSGLLAIGRIRDKPMAVNGGLFVRPAATFSLSFDHRIIDGAAAAKFLDDLDAALQTPRQFLKDAR